MTLFDAVSGQRYEITGLFVKEEMTRRLQALGLNDGTVVYIENRKKCGALVVDVRGTKLAIGKQLSSGIEVRRVN